MLITCPECENIVSNKAEHCPHCGCPNEYLSEVKPFNLYIIGKKVKHKKFGEGNVLSYVDGIIEIEFEGNGIKKFTLDSFVNFSTDIIISNRIMNEIKLREIEAYVENLIERKKTQQEESYEIPDGWGGEPAGYYEANESELDYYDYLEHDDCGVDSISDTYAYYYGDDEIL